MSSNKRILVTGGTGKTGRRLVERLQDAGVSVRIGSRTGQPSFNWEDASTWATALQDIDAVYIAYQPDLAVPGAVETIKAFTDLAVNLGVTQLVLLSGRGEEEAQRCEEIVKNAGVNWTILRASWFFQNFSENFLLDSLLAGTVHLPVGDVKEPFIDTEDIADVAYAVLTEAGHDGQLYELTGPRMLTFSDALGEISTAINRPISYVQISAEDYAAGMEAQNMPPGVIWLVNYLFTTVMDGRNAYLTDGVQRALKRQPRDFSDYVQRTAGTGIWNS